MKKHLLRLSLLSALASSSAMAAGPVANIQVSGDIKPPTCTVNGATQGDVIFDHGVISPSMVPLSSVYLYPYNTTLQDITVTCDAQTYLTFKPTDTYESVNTAQLVFPGSTQGQVRNDIFFRLVSASDPTTAIGGTVFTVTKSSVDGNTTVISRANDGIYVTGSLTGLNQVLIKQATMTWTKNNENNKAPEDLPLISGEIFSMTLQNSFQDNDTNPYKTFITSQNALAASGISISDGLDFMGEAVLTFNFGV